MYTFGLEQREEMKKLFLFTILASGFLSSSLQAFSLQSACILKTNIGNDVFYINLKQVASISHAINDDKHLSIPHKKDDNLHMILHINKGNQYRVHVKDKNEREKLLAKYQDCLKN